MNNRDDVTYLAALYNQGVERIEIAKEKVAIERRNYEEGRYFRRSCLGIFWGMYYLNLAIACYMMWGILQPAGVLIAVGLAGGFHAIIHHIAIQGGEGRVRKR